MAARKKRKAAPEKSKAGRKKEIKRFELEIADASSEYNLEGCEIAFVVRTSGGTPLNTTDTGKLYRLLQHELRALGHKLKRKGQELDLAEPEKAEPASAADNPEDDDAKRHDPDDEQPEEVPDSAPESEEVALADPDDSDAHNPSTPQ